MHVHIMSSPTSLALSHSLLVGTCDLLLSCALAVTVVANKQLCICEFFPHFNVKRTSTVIIKMRVVYY